MHGETSERMLAGHRKHQPETPPPPWRGYMMTALDGMLCMRARRKDDIGWPRRRPPSKGKQWQKRFRKVMDTPTYECSGPSMEEVVDG